MIFKINYPINPQSLKEMIAEYKVVHLTGVSTMQNCIELSRQLGEFIPLEENLTTGDKTGGIYTDIKFDTSIKNSYRHSNTRQPLHTDGAYESIAPNICFLYCLNSSSFGGETIFLYYQQLIDLLQITNNDTLLGDLKSKPIRHFKGNDEKIRPIIENDTLNWNYFRAEQSDSVKETIEKFKFFLDHIEQCNITEKILLRPGEIVFFLDDQVLHGRNAFIDTFNNQRWLKKGGIQCKI